MSEIKWTAHALVEMLRDKHHEDVFVSECKNGPSQGASHLRLDAWVMRRSWSKFCTIGYEVKVNRGDFLSDEKWPNYLKYCHRFYFVAPKGVIQPNELTDGVGLLNPTSTGSMLRTVRKSAFRDIEVPSMLYEYILMCRTKIKDERDSLRNNVAYWEDWLKQKDHNKSIGHLVKGKLATTIREVQAENERLLSRMDGYERIKEILRELDIDPDKSVSGYRVRDSLDRTRGLRVFRRVLDDVLSRGKVLLDKIDEKVSP